MLEFLRCSGFCPGIPQGGTLKNMYPREGVRILNGIAQYCAAVFIDVSL